MMVIPLSLSPEDGARDRRRPAPARQERGVDVEAAKARGREDRPRQNEPVGHDHRRIEGQGGEMRRFRGIAEALGRAHGKLVRLGETRDSGGLKPLAATGRPCWLGIDRLHVVTGAEEGLECRHGKFGRSHEGEPHGHDAPRRLTQARPL